MFLLLAALAAGVADPLVFRAETTVSGPVVTLADVADLSSLPPRLRERAERLPVATISTSRTVLSTRAVSARARAAVPGLTSWLPDRTDRDIVALAPALAAAPAALRVAADGAIQTGDRLTVRVEVGPVAVEREVTALQAGQPGRDLFVRTAEGVLLTVQAGPRP